MIPVARVGQREHVRQSMSSVDEERVGRVVRRAVRALRVVVVSAGGAGAVTPIEGQRCVGLCAGGVSRGQTPLPGYGWRAWLLPVGDRPRRASIGATDRRRWGTPLRRQCRG